MGALVIRNDSADDSEPEAAALGPREFTTGELPTHERQFLRCDTDAAILHLDDDVLSVTPSRNTYEAFARRITDRVVDQVVERRIIAARSP